MIRRAVAPLACVLVAALPGACQDADVDPLALVVNQETRAALSLDVAVPSLASVAKRIQPDVSSVPKARLDRWIGRWQASWLAEEGEGHRARQTLYDEAAGPLAEALGPRGVATTVSRLEEALAAASSADLSGLSEQYRRRIQAARMQIVEARGMLEEERPSDALRSALEAGDRLRGVSPRRVAVSLLERAEEAQRRIPEFSTYSRREKERIARLVRTARDAVEKGEYRLAIHRAYYACQLLDVELDR